MRKTPNPGVSLLETVINQKEEEAAGALPEILDPMKTSLFMRNVSNTNKDGVIISIIN